MKENSIKDIIEEKYTRYLNCETDIIGLTLEEAKFILETGERRNYVTSILQEAVKVLLSDYKRVLKENNRLEEQVEYDKTHIYTPQTIELNFISKSKIEDKIEELKEKEQGIKENEWLLCSSINYMKIQVLQELLEREK